MMAFRVLLCMILGAVYCAPPDIPCPAPASFEHGQTSLHEEGHIAMYTCDAGYVLLGKEIVRCIEGKWEEAEPVCIEDGDENTEDFEKEEKVNATSNGLRLGGKAPAFLSSLRGIPQKVRSGKIQSADDLEGVMKRSQKGKPKPDVNVTAENGGDATSVSMDEEGYQSDDALRQLYWYAHYYHHGAPVMTLTESQLAWINSLHPQLRDEYLRNMYVMRVDNAVEPERVQALVARDAYNYVYNYNVPYVRRPVSLIVEDSISTYDFSCSRSGYPFIKAPRLSNMHVARYDRRQNSNSPYQYYISAVYRCNPGYEMLDNRYTELHCSRQDWVGVRPVCVRRN